MEYQIVSKYNTGDLYNLINNLIKNGWEPIGGITVIQFRNELVFYQAMIRKEKKKRKSITFKPPTFDEVFTYCNQRKNSVNPKQWTNHYTAKNWMIGKNKMKDWKAAVRTWENSGLNNGKEPPLSEDIGSQLENQKLPPL